MIKEAFVQNVENYCNKNNITVSEFERKCGLGNGTVRGWKKSSPRLGTVEKVAAEIGISALKLLSCKSIKKEGL